MTQVVRDKDIHTKLSLFAIIESEAISYPVKCMLLEPDANHVNLHVIPSSMVIYYIYDSFVWITSKLRRDQ